MVLWIALTSTVAAVTSLRPTSGASIYITTFGDVPSNPACTFPAATLYLQFVDSDGNGCVASHRVDTNNVVHPVISPDLSSGCCRLRSAFVSFMQPLRPQEFSFRGVKNVWMENLGLYKNIRLLAARSLLTRLWRYLPVATHCKHSVQSLMIFLLETLAYVGGWTTQVDLVSSG